MQNDGLLLLGRASGPIRWTAGEHPLPVTILPRAEEGVSVGATLHTDEASACRRMAGTGRKRRTVLPSRKERAWDEAGDSVREVYGRTSVWMAPHFTRESDMGLAFIEGSLENKGCASPTGGRSMYHERENGGKRAPGPRE